VITQHQKSKAEFLRLRDYFNDIALETDHAFIATNFTWHCKAATVASDCEVLTMMK